MTAAGHARVDHYDWAGGREPMLRFGPEGGAVVLVALPLLEEANRTRAMAVSVLRGLAERGIGGALPELPGTGESIVATEEMRLADLRGAFAAAAAHVGSDARPVAIRSGALLVGPHVGRKGAGSWLLSPQDGDEVVREWRRLRTMGDGETVAGNRLSAAFWQDLADTSGSPAARVVRLQGDPRPADLVLAGTPPWRRAEPGDDAALAALVAEDIGRWIARCAA